MSASFYVYETKYRNPRKCEICGIGMAKGYLHEETSTTFCSHYCASRQLGGEDIEEMLSTGEIFWTEWHDEVEAME